MTEVRDVELAEETTEKSDAIAVVAPPAPRTVIVHKIGTPTRAGLVLAQDAVDSTVGYP